MLHRAHVAEAVRAGFSTGQKLGSLLALALSIELFFLTLPVGSEFHKNKAQRLQGLVATTAIAILLLVASAEVI